MAASCPSSPPQKIAFLFRYGAGEHVDFLPSLEEIAEILLRSGAEVHHYGFRSDRPIPERLKRAMQIHELPFRVRRSSAWDKHLKACLWLLLLPLLGRHLKRKGFHTVFVDETLPLSAPLLRSAFPGCLAFTIHDFFVDIYLMKHPLFRPLGAWVKGLDLRAWRKLDAVFTRVQAAKDFLAGQGLDASRIHVVYDPVNLHQFCPGDRPAARQRLGFAPEDIVLVHHGILHPNKGNLRVVEALHRLRQRLPTLKFLLIGDGPEMPSLRRRVQELGLQEVVLLKGWLPTLMDIADALRASDIGLVMRKGDDGDHFHVTSTLVHNMASGLPLLAVRLHGICEVLQEGHEGLLFDPSCGAEFDDNLLRLATDAALRARMGHCARASAERLFDPVDIARRYAGPLLADTQPS
jgi:glycosyltransferase involved in cell wall biosynthesis